jgi:hypothetical protein
LVSTTPPPPPPPPFDLIGPSMSCPFRCLCVFERSCRAYVGLCFSVSSQRWSSSMPAALQQPVHSSASAAAAAPCCKVRLLWSHSLSLSLSACLPACLLNNSPSGLDKGVVLIVARMLIEVWLLPFPFPFVFCAFSRTNLISVYFIHHHHPPFFFFFFFLFLLLLFPVFSLTLISESSVLTTCLPDARRCSLAGCEAF